MEALPSLLESMSVQLLMFCLGADAQNLEFGIDCDSRLALVGPNGAGTGRQSTQCK